MSTTSVLGEDAGTRPEGGASRGKAARSSAPRSSHSEWSPPRGRLDPVAVLTAQNASRLPELVPVRHGRMLSSPFSFFRGAAAIMAQDLVSTPTSGLGVQLCGDAHLSNFGLFASPERQLVFDLNDFDETIPGPWEWDLKRLAASLTVAGRERAFSAKQRKEIVLVTVGTYQQAMRSFARLRNLEVWYAQMNRATLDDLQLDVGSRQVQRARAVADKARRRDSLRALERLTTVADGKLRLVDDPPLIVRLAELLPGAEGEALEAALRAVFERYTESLPDELKHLMSGYRIVDMARKVVGVGSVGTRCWVLLLMGHDNRDPLFLQAKEALPSSLEGAACTNRYHNQGQRVVEGQRLMQASSDLFLGWLRTTGLDGQSRDFYLRQLWDWKGSFDPEASVPRGVAAYGRVCGWTLARAHARSGDRSAIAAYLGSGDSFARALAEFSERYADQNESDYGAFAAAARDSRIDVRADL